MGALLLIMAGAAAFPDPQLDSCMQKAMTSLDQSTCMSAALARADARLNVKWRKLMSHLKTGYSAKVRADLVQEQRAWIAFKDKACLFYWNQPSFGSLHRSIEGPSCRLQIINERIADLENISIALSPEDSPIQPRELGSTKE